MSKCALYLDFYSVLHPKSVYWHPKGGLLGVGCAGYSLFESASLLSEALVPYQQTRIALLTSWLRVLSYAFGKAYMPEPLHMRVIGAWGCNTEFTNGLTVTASPEKRIWGAQ